MAHPSLSMDAEQLALYKAAFGAVSAMQLPRLFSSDNPHDYIYFVAFDGTGNNGNSLEPGYQNSNPDLLESKLSSMQTSKFVLKYYQGVATENTSADTLNTATGDGAVAFVDKAWKTYIDTAKASDVGAVTGSNCSSYLLK